METADASSTKPLVFAKQPSPGRPDIKGWRRSKCVPGRGGSDDSVSRERTLWGGRFGLSPAFWSPTTTRDRRTSWHVTHFRTRDRHRFDSRGVGVHCRASARNNARRELRNAFVHRSDNVIRGEQWRKPRENLSGINAWMSGLVLQNSTEKASTKGTEQPPTQNQVHIPWKIQIQTSSTRSCLCFKT